MGCKVAAEDQGSASGQSNAWTPEIEEAGVVTSLGPRVICSIWL